ncbi:ABC-type nitrate/sulfonate/bicarbonate transport system, periplasmic component [Opitutaceae bacterium TAV1]|nr:ABC-type nitrate/sulfonate/bicarbonate transport system, periplasmic component [Opitutaceae bacterium TAV1]
MKIKNHIRAKTVAALTALTALVTLSSTATAQSKKQPVINIPINTWTAVAAKRGWLQEEFGKYGARVSLLDQGTSAVAGQEAALLARGDLHFAFRMSYPTLIHKTNGLEGRIIWQSEASDIYRTPLLALSESPLESIADLKGKNYGGSRVGCGWSSPYEALRDAGLPLDASGKKGEVRYTNISSGTAITSALLGGKIDFTATHIALGGWPNLIIQGVIKVIGRSPSDGEYVNGAGRPCIFVLGEFADSHPELVKAFIATHDRTVKWIKENPDQAASIIARETRVPLYVAKFSVTDASAYDYMNGEPSYEAAVSNIKSFQKWYKENDDDILTKQSLSDAQIEDFVDKRFFKGGEFSAYN